MGRIGRAAFKILPWILFKVAALQSSIAVLTLVVGGNLVKVMSWYETNGAMPIR
jgi:hypothetical protein